MRKIFARLFLSLAAGVLVAPLSAFAQDPGTTGPLTVTTEGYSDGDTAFNPGTFPGPAEITAEVYRPTNLTGGPFPLIIFLHGRHGTCTSTFTWPCPAGQTSIPSYKGYAYIGQRLASWGYIVVSISANGINARDNSTADLGAQWRAELIQAHLNKWNTFNTVGGFPTGTNFVGKVDMNNIGTMGHSRGGEGVMRHFLYNQSLGSPYGIKAIFPLAPVDFNRPIINGVPHDTLLPYCDGDVSDLQGVHYYDDARYSAPGDLTPKHTVYFMGANHNFANTVWTSGFPGAGDDWGGVIGDVQCDQGQPTRWSASKQQSATRTYMMGFFRRYIGGETQFDAMLKKDIAPPASSSLSANEAYVMYHAPDSATQRRDVNRYLTQSALTVNQLGGAVTASGFTPNDACGGASPEPSPCNPAEPNSRQPHTTPSARSAAPGMSQLRGGYTSTSATYTNALPAGSRDVSGFQMLQFRASTNYADARNAPGTAQDFVVRLTDGTGAFADAMVSTFSGILFYPPGSSVAEVPKVVLNTARIPLSAFGGINLSDVRTIQFRFNQRSSGAFLITDIAFADAGTPVAFPDLTETAVSNPPATIAAGGNFSVTDTVQVSGSVGAGASTTRYYLSTDTAKSVGDVLLTGSRSVPALGVGGSSSGTVSVTVPGATAAGTYFLLACADDTGSVPESNEGNNCRASTTTVDVQAAPAADLVVTAVSNPPSSVAIGGTFVITDTTLNQGGSPTLINTKTKYYLSLDTVKGKGDKPLTGARTVPPLAAGASSTGSKTVTVKLTTVPGTYFLIACADGAKKVAESNEGNNCKASTTQVVVH